MSYKPKKVDNKKKKKEKDPNKFHLGWNAGTYLLITLGLAIIALILIAFTVTLWGENSYYKTYQNNTQHPFADDKNNYEDCVFKEASEFNEFTINFYAKSFDSHDEKKAVFSVEILTNENTGGKLDRINSKLEKDSSSSFALAAQINLSNNWIGYNQYSTLSTSTMFSSSYLNEETKQSKTISVSLSNTPLPTKTNTWPVPIEVKWPEAYLFICYYIEGQSTPKKFVIHYAPEDYIVKEKTDNREITTPAI